jgi:hypothetical protein
MVPVEVRNSTSISPEPSAVKRVEEDTGAKRTFDGSLKIAAARPRQRSVSSPCQTPWLSGSAKPAMPVWTPQISWPRARTASSVGVDAGWADAAPEYTAHRAAIAAAKPRRNMVICLSCR